MLWSIKYFQGPKPEEKPVTSSGGTATDANPSGPASSTAGTSTSTDNHRNYAVLAGTIAILGGVGWYLKSSSKKPEVQDWGWSAFGYMKNEKCMNAKLLCLGLIEWLDDENKSNPGM